jgi:hypothetical protein
MGAAKAGATARRVAKVVEKRMLNWIEKRWKKSRVESKKKRLELEKIKLERKKESLVA